jgi:hypothetical protein
MRAFAECLQQVLDWPNDVPKQNSIDGSTTGKGRNAVYDKTRLEWPMSAKGQSRQFVCLPVSSGFPRTSDIVRPTLQVSKVPKAEAERRRPPARPSNSNQHQHVYIAAPRSSLRARNEMRLLCIRLCIARSSHLDRAKFIRNFSRIGDQCARRVQQ